MDKVLTGIISLTDIYPYLIYVIMFIYYYFKTLVDIPLLLKKATKSPSNLQPAPNDYYQQYDQPFQSGQYYQSSQQFQNNQNF